MTIGISCAGGSRKFRRTLLSPHEQYCGIYIGVPHHSGKLPHGVGGRCKAKVESSFVER